MLEDEQAPVCTFDGKKVINLASNNYLGLTTHPKLREAALEATRKFGVGSGAVRTIAGTMKIHMELEEKIARFKNVEACVVFQSGFAANAGTVSAVLGKDDFIISDALNHASIIDGARLSKAKILVFRHKDIAHAEEQLTSIKNEPGKKLLITDGVFSMDGDIGPLPALCDLAEKYGAIMMVDDAHASGVLGRNGRGTIDHFGMHGRVDIQVGTLSKAIGALGGYVCGTRDLIDFLYHRARPFLFSTSHPPSVAATCIAAFDVLENEPERMDEALGEHALLEKRTRPAGLRHRRAGHAGQRDSDHADHHRRRQAHHGLLPRAVQRRRARDRHRISDSARGQGAHPHHHDGDAHEGRVGAGARGARKASGSGWGFWQVTKPSRASLGSARSKTRPHTIRPRRSSLWNDFNRRHRRVPRDGHEFQKELALGVGFQALDLAHQGTILPGLLEDVQIGQDCLAIAEDVEHPVFGARRCLTPQTHCGLGLCRSRGVR